MLKEVFQNSPGNRAVFDFLEVVGVEPTSEEIVKSGLQAYSSQARHFCPYFKAKTGLPRIASLILHQHFPSENQKCRCPHFKRRKLRAALGAKHRKQQLL